MIKRINRKKPGIVSANEFPRICIQTCSNHRILRHFRRIIVLPRFCTEIRLSFGPYASSRAAREPISIYLGNLTLNEPITDTKSVMVKWEESEASGVTSLT
jgi:hypothetical protein